MHHAEASRPANLLAIHLQNVSFAYDRRHPVLRIEELAVTAGEQVFLHGPSGSGKTTLLGLITGLLQPDAGRCTVLGKELTGLTSAARDTHRGSEMGYIFQGFNLIPYLSVRDNVALPCRVHSRRRARITAGSVHEEVERLAERLELGPYLDRGVGRLSTGQQQRVAIARAIIGRPSLVIADEPTSALDADRRNSFLDLLFEVCVEAHSTLLFVSHDASLMPRFSRHLALPRINRVNA